MGVLNTLNPFSSGEDAVEQTAGEVQNTPPAGVDITGDGPECSFCGQPGSDKKWAGQTFHKKCLRKARKMAKGML
ncbi:hypothetical protein ACFLQ2_05020 [archaeon]